MNYAQILVKQGAKQISRLGFQIGKHSVRFQTKKGRRLLLCDCDNASYFGHNQFCYHKEAAIILKNNKKLYDKLDQLIEEYRMYNKTNKEIIPLQMLNDLKDLRKAKE